MLDVIELWHKRARPNPTADNLAVQMGCHAEEFLEMLEALVPTLEVRAAMKAVADIADLWKSGAHYVQIRDREALLDSLADQIVTAVGVGHCANMNVHEATMRVNKSNWSKYTPDGQPIFTEKGKIAKGPGYVAPDLAGLF
jgi:hypothetical protein